MRRHGAEEKVVTHRYSERALFGRLLSEARPYWGHWASTHLAFSSAEKGMRHLRFYPADLRDALLALVME